VVLQLAQHRQHTDDRCLTFFQPWSDTGHTNQRFTRYQRCQCTNYWCVTFVSLHLCRCSVDCTRISRPSLSTTHRSTVTFAVWALSFRLCTRSSTITGWSTRPTAAALCPRALVSACLCHVWYFLIDLVFYILLEMWANAQRDGRPAEYRWRPLFNAAKFGWRPLLECRAVTLPRRETRWNLQGCPKLPDRFQPLVGWSSLYCGDTCRRYCCLTSFFPTVNTCLNCEDIARQSCAIVPIWWLFGDFLGPALPASRAQQVSELHPKFALEPHRVSKYGRHPMCGRWD